MMIRKLLLPALFAVATFAAFADGTVLFDPDIRKILDQRPFFANDLYESYDFASQASATRIGSEASAQLAGARVGPYRIAVKRKDAAGAFDREIVINCSTIFLDSKGKETDNLKQAISIKEEFISIEIEPLKK